MADKTKGDWWYRDWCNPGYYLKRAMHNKDAGIFYGFKDIKNIICTAISMARYEDIDQTICPGLTSDIIETALMFKNNLCFAKVATLGWYLCNYVEQGDEDPYNHSDKVDVKTLNGQYVGEYDYDDIIILKDNALDIPVFLTLWEYIDKLQYIESVEQKVLQNCTLPLALIGNKKQANQLKAVAQQLGVTTPYIIGDDTILDQVRSFDINVPISPLDIYDLRRKWHNEALSSIGIYSVEEKRERIVTQELVNQNDYTDFVYSARMNYRRDAINELNKRSGGHIKFVEMYDINYYDSVKDEAFKEKELSKGQAQGEIEGNPNADKEVKPNVGKDKFKSV